MDKNKFSKIKIFYIIFTSLIISFIISFCITNHKNISSYIKLISNKTNIEIGNIKYIGYDFNDGKYISMDKDATIYLPEINDYIVNLKLIFDSPNKDNLNMKVYCQQNNDILFVNNRTIPKNTLSYTFSIDRNLEGLLLNIGNDVGDSFELKQIVYNIKPSLNVNINFVFILRMLIICIIILFIYFHIVTDIKTLYSFLFKYKFYIALLVLFVFFAFKFNFSSLGAWNDYVFNNVQNNLIIGKSLQIKNDEWATYSAITISQYPNFPYFNDILRGTKTDMFMVYGQPVKNIACIFRPFLLPFLFFDYEHALSLHWIIKYLFLFFVTFYFFMILTKNKKYLSFIFTILVFFASPVQYWTQVPFAEMIIFAELFIVMSYMYIINNKFLNRLLYLSIMLICSISYMLCLYPAWQISFAYIFFILLICIFYEYKNKFVVSKKDVFLILFFLTFFVLILIYIFLKSKDTIFCVMNTSYPGARFENGGGSVTRFFKYFINVFFSTKDILPTSNIVEESVFFDFFPIGIIFSILVLLKNKIKDKLLMFLLILDIFFLIRCLSPFPSFISKITLLKFVPTERLYIAVGFLNLLILARSSSILKIGFSKKISILISLVVTITVILSNIILYKAYLSADMIIVVLLLSFSSLYYLLQLKLNKQFLLIVVVVMFFCGAVANPLQMGVNIFNAPLYNAITEINISSPGIWIVEGMSLPMTNYPIICKVPTLTSTNIYPNLELWSKLDKDKKYYDIYNRYCHVEMQLYDEKTNIEKFVLKEKDSIKINLHPEDLITLNVKYILSSDNNLERFGNDKIQINKIYKDSQYFIYKTDIKGEI